MGILRLSVLPVFMIPQFLACGDLPKHEQSNASDQKVAVSQSFAEKSSNQDRLKIQTESNSNSEGKENRLEETGKRSLSINGQITSYGNEDHDAIGAIVEKDFLGLNPAIQSDVRYVSIRHISVEKGQRNIVLQGIHKAINSVSWAQNIILLDPIDEEETVFRFQLSKFMWRPSHWNLISSGEYAAENIEKLASGVEFVLGDWLVFILTRPEIYDRLLALPPLESMLESKLGVDRTQAKYLGVYKSPVAYSSRILERIPIVQNGKEGYYWRSYDFLFNAQAERNLRDGNLEFTKSRNVSDLIAGEFIFSLPNGLQGYMLSGFGSQHRFDADARVARDSRRDDQLVINGESCITCHSHGIHIRKDEVRPNLSSDNLEKLKFSYPQQSELDRLFQKDNERFAQALQKIGISGAGSEPVGSTLTIFLELRGISDRRQQSGETDAVFRN